MSRKKSLIGLLFSLPGNIRKIRGDLSQAKFADLIGVNQGTVHKYEKGISSPSEETLKKIAAHGGVTVEWLLHGDKKPELPDLPESMTIESPPPGAGPGLHDPYLFGGVDIDAMSQILELVEDHLSHRKRPLKNVKKALLISLLYDRFQTTGRVPGPDTLKEFLRRVD
jgi:transcriptional regulator with XRE-family HTH domain